MASFEEKFKKSFSDMSKKHAENVKNMKGENAKAALFVALITFELLGKEACELYERTTAVYLSAVEKAGKGGNSVLSGS